MVNLLLDIQEAAKARLETIDDFSGVDIFIEEKGDPVSQMEQALAKRSLGVYIATPVLTAKTQDIPGPYFMTIQILVQVYEVTAMNRAKQGSGKTAAFLALYASNALHLFHPEGMGGFRIATGRPAITSSLDGGILIYDVNLETHGGLTTQ